MNTQHEPAPGHVPPGTTPQGVAEYLGRDHDAIDVILADALRMAEDGETERAEHTFAEFADGLRRHIAIEEELLFPVFDRRHGFGGCGRPGGPSSVMVLEHRSIQNALAECQHALASLGKIDFREPFAHLRQLVEMHNVKEEQVLYPIIDRALSPTERVELVARMRQVK